MGEDMEREMRIEHGEDDTEKWVHDSSMDYQGRVPLRASTGVWKASLFIITIEFSERLSYFGMSTNLITYLTRVIHMDLKTAAKNVNYWSGVTTTIPLLGGFLADSYTGRFLMILLSSIIYLLGLGLLTMSEFIPSLKPCGNDHLCHHSSKVHKVAFFLAMYFVSLGTGGHKPCLESFGADQFDDNHLEERNQKMSFFNLWNIALCCGLILGVTFIVYVEDFVSWGVSALILSVIMAITIIIFCFGRPFYRYQLPEGSPLTPMLQVLVAAMKKRNLAYPLSDDQLYEVPKSEKSNGRLLKHTNNLRFLDKAAIVEGNDNSSPSHYKNQSPWRLATVTQIEELKLVIKMIPIWLTSLPFGVCVAQALTFFIKQSATMDRKIANGFEIPAASIFSLVGIGMMFCVTVYEKILEPMLRRATGNERGIKILQRIGIGMVFSVLGMSIAAIVERKRLRTVETASVAMSVFWLSPQFLILGIADGFTLVGLQEYFYDQVPDSMRSLGIAFYLSVIGVGSFISGFLITIVDHITVMTSGTSWFGKDMNKSRLDNFYWLLAAINGLNLCVYVFLARRYTYKNVQ